MKYIYTSTALTGPWVLSGSGTNEYYRSTSTTEPSHVFLGGRKATAGTHGSLSSGEWAYGDNDSLGYSTVYVVINETDKDPDSQEFGYVEASYRETVDSKLNDDQNTDEIDYASLSTSVRLSALYNLLPANSRAYTALGGSVTASGRNFVCATGTTQYAYAALQSFRAINHRDGLGVRIEFGAEFPDSTTNSWIGVGGFTIGDEVSFGYNGTSFGVWHRYGGLPENRELQITGAAGGSENASLTLNGVVLTIPLTAGTVQKNAKEIADYITANSTAWNAQQLDDTVIISSTDDQTKAGAFAFSSSTATGSITQVTAAVTKTSDFVSQTNWNGRVPSGFDPTKGNNYEIRFFNGFGGIRFYIVDPQTDTNWLVHTIPWANSGNVENFANPSLHLGAYAYSLGSTTNLTVKCSSIASFIEGPIETTRNPRAYRFTKSIDTTLTNLLTLRVKRDYNGLTNQSEILPINLTLANDGTKSAVFDLYTNATVGGDPNFQSVGTNLITDIDTSGTTVSGGRFIASFTVAKGQSIEIDLTKFQVVLPPTLRLTIAAAMTSGVAADLTATITWYEDN